MCESHWGSLPVERIGEFPPTNAGKEMASPSPTLFSFPRTLLPNVYVCVCVRALKTEPPSLRSQPLNTEKGGKRGERKKSRKKEEIHPFPPPRGFPYVQSKRIFFFEKPSSETGFSSMRYMGKRFFCLGTFVCLTGGALSQFPKWRSLDDAGVKTDLITLFQVSNAMYRIQYMCTPDI